MQWRSIPRSPACSPAGSSSPATSTTSPASACSSTMLADTAERYDLIELALALTGNAHAQPAGMEAHLYTVEAVQLYLSRLTPTGVLVLIHSDPGNAYRQLLTVIEALETNGIGRARAL